MCVCGSTSPLGVGGIGCFLLCFVGVVGLSVYWGLMSLGCGYAGSEGGERLLTAICEGYWREIVDMFGGSGY